MARNILHEGSESDVMPWTNNTGADVASGAVVKIGNTIGVALCAIANGAVGSVAIEGVIVNVPKEAGAAWAQGEALQWDVSASAFANSAAVPASGDVTGGAVAWLAAAAGDVTGTIKLTPGNTTVTP